MLKFSHRFRYALAGLACVAATTSVQAAEFLSRPVTLYVGTPAGGAVDVYARIMAEGLSRELGQTVLVENRSGANGNIAAQNVLQQAPDGHALWVGSQAMVEINPSAFSHMPWKPADFTPLIRGVEAPLVLVTHPSVPATDLPSLLKWIKERPGTGYASFSPGTPSHFLGYQFSAEHDLDMVHIPYRGSAPQVTDLVGGHAPLGFSQVQTSLPMIQEDRLRAIATTGAERSRYLPEVPTLRELGYDNMDTTIWFGVLAPASVPADIQEKLTAALIKAHENPEVRTRLEEAGYDVSGETGQSLIDSIESSRERWAKLVEASGFEASN